MKRVLFTALVATMLPTAFAANLVVNGNMETFSGNVPTGWSAIQISSAGVAGGSYTCNQSTDNPGGAGNANSLEINNPGAQDLTNRYKAHSNSFKATTAVGTLTASLKGASARIMLGRSTDAGATWTVSGAASDVINGNSATWVTPAPVTGVTSNFNNALPNQRCRLSMHTFTATASAFYDNVSLDATEIPVTMSGFTID